MKMQDIIRRPLVTEKGVAKKDNERTLCFEVALDANKTQVKAAVEKLFKVKVEEVRTANFEGKLRRRGRFARTGRRIFAATRRPDRTRPAPSRTSSAR